MYWKFKMILELSSVEMRSSSNFLKRDKKKEGLKALFYILRCYFLTSNLPFCRSKPLACT